MKRFILTVGVIVVVLLAIALLNFSAGAKRAIQYAGSAALGVPVDVDGIKISLSKRSVSIDKIFVANPEGFKSKNILEAENISVTLGDVSRHLITINNITVDGMAVVYEIGLNGTNFDAIKSKIRSTSPDHASRIAESENPKASSHEVIIKELKIINAQLVPAIGGQSTPVKMPDITITDIGNKNDPATGVGVAMQVMNRIMTTSSATLIKSGFTDGTKRITEGLKSLFD